jgi:hypothetical protein
MRSPFLQGALRGLHRRFWIVGAATVAVCGVLAARAAGHVVEARYLDDATHAPPLPRVAPAAPVTPAPVPRNSALLVERNMFCSDCGGAGAPEPSPDGAIASTLPLVLVATNVGAQPWATLRSTTSDVQGAFAVGDRVPQIGAVAAIGHTYVDVHNDAAGGRVERVRLLADAPAATAAPSVATADPAAPANPYADRVRKIDDNTYEVDRALVKELVAGGQAKGARVTPVTKGDKLIGVRVMQAKADSVAGAIGLKPGDVIQAIDGQKIESAQQLIDMVAKLDDISSVRLEGTRRGKAELSLELRLK